ncbi:MAG TPA: DUF3144 domain-containing protein [Pyrinomonadaceae bacterium]
MTDFDEPELDDKFFERADAHIHLSNAQTADTGIGKVSSSMMYATARFNSWVSACGFQTSSDMEAAKEETIEYFVEQYRLMLEENLNDYIRNFSKYMATAEGDDPEGKTRRELFDR